MCTSVSEVFLSPGSDFCACILSFLCLIEWHIGAVVCTIASKREDRGFEVTSRVGTFYVELVCSLCACGRFFLLPHTLQSKDMQVRLTDSQLAVGVM